MIEVAVSLSAVTLLAVAHLLGGGLRVLDRVPRSRWLSAGAGVSIAYVFAHLLPELAVTQHEVEEGAGDVLAFFEDHAYLIALAGFVLFYGVELIGRDRDGERDATAHIFWVSMASYAAYNAVIGYLIVHREDDELTDLLLFAVAIGVHFVVNDFGLRERHKRPYAAVGRWVLVAALLAGYAVGRLTELDDATVGLLIAFLAGGVVLNAIKEELPSDRQSRFGAFAVGAVLYGALLQAV